MVNVKSTGWVGWIYFASAMLLIAGGLQVVAGLAGIFNPGFYTVTEAGNIIAFDYATWGWIHLLLGVGLIATGVGLSTGRTWARMAALVLSVLAAIAQLAFISVYPLWSIAALIIIGFVIYAITLHGDEA